MPPQVAAALLHDYLSAREPRPSRPLSLVIGFGHFDLRIPRHCCRLRVDGLAGSIAFTGGIGAGTGDLGRPEAEAFLAEAEKVLGHSGSREVIIEKESTNTGENLRFLDRILRVARPGLLEQSGAHPIGLVATPIRMRRVMLTARKHWPSACLVALPPDSDPESDTKLFASKGENLIASMLGELQRIEKYPALGYCMGEEIPAAVAEAVRQLRQLHG